MPPPTALRTCIDCRRHSKPMTFDEAQDARVVGAAWVQLEAEGWHTDSRGNQRCGTCPERYPEELGIFSLCHGVPC